MKNDSVTVKDIINRYSDNLANLYPRQEARQIISWLFEFRLGWNRATTQLSLNERLTDSDVEFFMNAAEKLTSGEPIHYILGLAWFNGRMLRVDRNVLIPRPETEELCGIIRNDLKDAASEQFSVLDIGTGSGCIAIDLKSSFSASRMTSVDISESALKVAKENSEQFGLEIELLQLDILKPDAWQQLGNYDIIVSNPPYVLEREKRDMHSNVLCFEPASALFVPDEDPLVFYDAIIRCSATHLDKAGRLYFEINAKFGDELCNLLTDNGFINVSLLNDMNEKPRFIRAFKGA